MTLIWKNMFYIPILFFKKNQNQTVKSKESDYYHRINRFLQIKYSIISVIIKLNVLSFTLEFPEWLYSTDLAGSPDFDNMRRELVLFIVGVKVRNRRVHSLGVYLTVGVERKLQNTNYVLV